MKPWLRWLLIVAAVVLLACLQVWGLHEVRSLIAAALEQNSGQARERAELRKAGPLPEGRLFTREETNTFLDAAKRAEAIADPVQRCLAYPDPPHSHWDHDAVVAYCKYHNQPIIAFQEVQRLVQDGKAAELDRRFAEALHAQETEPDAKGRLDRSFYADFHDGSFDVRSTLDAWKRESPQSAFALAASGYAYMEMAYKARGSDWVSKTPQDNFDSMDRLVMEADADLRRAIALNPHLTPAYQAMITLGGLTLGDRYALSAARRGLGVAPDDWGIYDQLLWLERPQWYGSLAAMRKVVAQAQTQSARNPLLKLMIPEVDLFRLDACDCSEKDQLPGYAAVLENVAHLGGLTDAADTAKDVGDPQELTVYESEVLRFDPTRTAARIDRIYGLVEFDNAQWAIADADRLLAASPNDEFAMKARGWAYLSINDLAHAEHDFRAATELDPTDMWALSRLGNVYLQNGQQWDKAWHVANRLIEKDPGHLDGWVMRATIQAQQPRPGLKETADHLESHFYTDKKNLQFNAYIAHLRAVAQGKVSGTLVLDGHG